MYSWKLWEQVQTKHLCPFKNPCTEIVNPSEVVLYVAFSVYYYELRERGCEVPVRTRVRHRLL